MKYVVEGLVAEVGGDMVLRLTNAQIEPRRHLLEEVKGGWRPTSVIQFKSGEEIDLQCKPADLPRPLHAVLVPVRGGRKRDKDQDDPCDPDDHDTSGDGGSDDDDDASDEGNPPEGDD